MISIAICLIVFVRHYLQFILVNMNELRAWLQEFYGTDDIKEATRLYDEHREESSGGYKYVMSFPYYAQDPSLPPLPTPEDLEEIRASEKRSNYKGYSFMGDMFRVNDVYAVKCHTAGGSLLFQVF